jgi:hypothetical protein
MDGGVGRFLLSMVQQRRNDTKDMGRPTYYLFDVAAVAVYSSFVKIQGNKGGM